MRRQQPRSAVPRSLPLSLCALCLAMSWLDSVSLRFLDPYNAAALSKYRELYAAAPPAVKGPLDVAEGWYKHAMATQDPRVKVRKQRAPRTAERRRSAHCGGRRRTSRGPRTQPTPRSRHAAPAVRAVLPLAVCVGLASFESLPQSVPRDRLPHHHLRARADHEASQRTHAHEVRAQRKQRTAKPVERGRRNH